MRRMKGFAPIFMTLILSTFACDTQPPEDGDASPPPGAEAAPSEELGSAVGLGGVAAYRGADADRDERLNPDELTAWFDESGTWDRWDSDGDGGLSADEFHTSAFALLDADDDRLLSQAEWKRGTGAWLRPERVGMWDDWDADADGFISPAEYNRELHEHNVYDTLDDNLSGILEPAEVANVWFRALDSNRDMGLEEQEWRAWNGSSQ